MPYSITSSSSADNSKKGIELKGCVAIVTGVNRPNGIGYAVVQALVKAGARKVYATGRKLSQLNELYNSQKDVVVPIELDMTDLDAIRSLPAKCPDVNVVVNNAGYILHNNGVLDDVDAARQEMLVNYLGPMALVNAFQSNLKNPKSNGGAAVVNVMSICSFVNFQVAGTYSCSKAAGHSMTVAQRRDLRKDNKCLVVGVYPGPIDTDIGEWNKGNPMPGPDVVTDSIVEALRNGTEDVFPDQQAAELHDEYLMGPKEQEIKLLKAANGIGQDNRK